MRLIGMMMSALAATGMLATAAAASPWAEVGDRQLREDVERLKAARVISGPINAWPLPWAAMSEVNAAAADVALAPEVRAAARRLAAHLDIAEQRQSYEIRAGFTNRPALIRDFGSVAREEADVSFRTQRQAGPLFVSLGAGYRNGQRGRDWHLEPSYLALKLGNWSLYGGYVEHWWGPGNDSALLFSNATRPFPKVGFKRLEAHPIDFPVLRWLGPWRLDAFVGTLNEKRDFENTKVIGLRFNFEPTPGLEIGLNRALQLCGKGRPCGLNTIGKALTGFGDADNTGTPDEPGNQLAGLDLSYTTRIGPVTARFYGEVEAEDEDNFIVDKFARMGGVKLSGPLNSSGSSWEGGFEYSDTLAWELKTGNRYPGVIYNNFIYTNGFTYRGRPIAASIDGDSRLIGFSGAITDTANRRWYGSLRHANLNRTSINRQGVSLTPEKIGIATGGIEWPTEFGDLKLEGRYMNNAPNSPGRSPDRAEIELGWRSRF
jgi:hypothetical protein